MTDTATCRGCHRNLDGKPYGLGGEARDPVTRVKARVNYYGGYVCSRACDERVCLQMSSSMPGAGEAKWLNSLEKQQVDDNWKECSSIR